MSFSYNHVWGHQDKHLSWRSLTLIEQLNVQCDSLAGQVMKYGAVDITVVDGQKLTSNVSEELWHYLIKDCTNTYTTLNQHGWAGMITR